MNSGIKEWNHELEYLLLHLVAKLLHSPTIYSLLSASPSSEERTFLGRQSNNSIEFDIKNRM